MECKPKFEPGEGCLEYFSDKGPNIVDSKELEEKHETKMAEESRFAALSNDLAAGRTKITTATKQIIAEITKFHERIYQNLTTSA
mmetsp:Transcript_30415/g.69630  ORF Transcript_30415/g.69630 Transcript_30415/m.69630 type:complete len:85 (-) Transcript_30415:199-453(-)|eukprot:CAMPEP_0113300348 /NCGR_PEP_ID=MMETSP0010_2-20120614/2016_1 /TAXON_ID=216773 ORGANISM="Corethron hystrix, Strain 308" /NCGR_SAMPLE_ID=MMETSP0010_2 /ASSEMBLY_ACC=CAM_ASM_000155 /LENGTH=84 /DNA_ID=CAMNT_0000153759 /DNA_START=574 /DNA_END=828 /DNA_ORIENTATION=- /assembly_acc=CAM_ASM_000155